MKAFLITSLFVSGSALLFFVFLLSYVFFPAGQRSEIVEVKVAQGETLSSVVRKLGEKGIITHERLFSLWARFSRVERKIHWGFYRFELPLSPGEILNRMVLGKGLFRRVTIPEGLTVKETAELLEKEEVVQQERFLKEASSPELLALLGLENKGIEGYLFPNTYYFTPFATDRDIILTMVDQFWKVFSPTLEQLGQGVALDSHEIITLASLIEKEAAIEEERPLVSAVFHNRLRRNMPLQSDPTVVYGLRNFSGTITRKHLQNPSPYNTYRIQGLPPGPICNPSLSSLRAALRPAPVPYLYFVSKNDGSHLFSETLEAHNRAVKIFQSSGGAPRKK